MIETQAELDAAVADAHRHGLAAEVIPTVDGDVLAVGTPAQIEFARRLYGNGVRRAASIVDGGGAA